MEKRLIKILLLAFVLRIILALLAEHGDVINYYWWSKDLLNRGLLGFYDRNIANAMRPTYPPVTSFIFWGSAVLHELIWQISWFLNAQIAIFPSNFIFWLESAKGWYFVNKIPAILADLGIIYLLFEFVKDLKDKKAAYLASLLFAFSPPFWYSSSLWGQTDSIYALTMLGAFYLLYKKKRTLSIFLYSLSILTKPTSLFALPAFALWWLKGAKIRDFYYAVIVGVGTLIILYLPFHPEGLLGWIINFYYKSLGGELNYIVANAFNFWGLIHGFNDVVETSPFLGLPSHIVGYLGYLVVIIPTIYLTWSRMKLDPTKVLFLAVLFSFFAFLILPRIHERYFYPTLLLLVPLAALDAKLRKVFWALSGIHLVNLYHFWWMPRIEVLVNVLSNRLIESFLIVLNISLFLWLFLIFKHDYAKKVK